MSSHRTCKNFVSIDCRDPTEIRSIVDSHKWRSMSSDRTPVGMISRFTCSRCGDEYVVMITSPSQIAKFDRLESRLEVSAESVII
jgi:hypothetical protein